MADAEFVWQPSGDQLQRSNMARFIRYCGEPDFDALYARTDRDPEWFWDKVFQFGEARFHKPYERIRDISRGVENAAWCVGGRMNFTAQCIEKFSDTQDGLAIVSSVENGVTREVSRGELFHAVSRFAGALRSLGVEPGDRVAVYMPMVPETVIAFLAVARLGAITVPLFSGFGPDAIATRLEQSQATVLVSVHSMQRRGKVVVTEPIIEQAMEQAGFKPDVVIHGAQDTRFLSWEALVRDASPVTDPEIVDADAPLLLIYTSGTTGKPKGAVLTHCGVTAKLISDLQLCLDLKAQDRWMWMSDFGWIIGPLMVGAALMTGATLVMADGAPDYPQTDRIWRLIEELQVSFLGVAPTLIRSAMANKSLALESYDLSSLRIVVSSGEPWTEAAWHWCFDNVCRQNAPILNWAGGTEISGGILTGTVLHPLKPMCFPTAVPGMGADIVDADGHAVGPGEVGELVLKTPSIGLTRSLWEDHDRYLETYWSDYPGVWKHGDLVSRDEDGYWLLHGRSDDVLKIGGKRTGPAEIENLVMATGLVQEVAIVGLPDDKAGQAIGCICVLKPPASDNSDVRKRIETAIVEGMGRPYRPKLIGFVDELPKTRSGKIVRRVIGAVFAGKGPGDMSSMANMAAIDQIKVLSKRV